MNIRPSATLEESLVKLAERNLTEPQKRVLLYIHERERGSRCTYSWYARVAAKELCLPESTAKWCLSTLRDLRLIESGTRLDKGVPLSITYPGFVVAEGLSKGRNIPKGVAPQEAHSSCRCNSL